MTQEYTTYTEWLLPTWAPPAWLFGPVWAFLYVVILLSFGYVFYKIYKGDYPKKVALPFILNLVFNFLFTPIQFGLENLWLAALDILLVLGTLTWAIWTIYPYNKNVAYAQIPYLLWVSFATVLQLTITYLNL